MILDVLAAVLTGLAARSRRAEWRAVDVQQRFGALRVRVRNISAVDLAEQYSVRVCEVSGAPGRLRETCGHYATRVPELAGPTSDKAWLDDVSRPDRCTPPVGLPMRAVLAHWAAELEGAVVKAPPPGWGDLLDVTCRYLITAVAPP